MQLSGTVTASRARCTLKSETPSSSSCNHLLSTPALSGQQRSRHEVDGLIWVAVRASMRSNVMPRSRHAYSGPSPLSVGPGPGHRLGKQAHVGEPASCRSLADFVLVLFAQDRCCLADDEDVPKQQSAGWKSQLGQCALTFGTAVFLHALSHAPAYALETCAAIMEDDGTLISLQVRSGFLALGVGPHGAVCVLLSHDSETGELCASPLSRWRSRFLRRQTTVHPCPRASQPADCKATQPFL